MAFHLMDHDDTDAIDIDVFIVGCRKLMGEAEATNLVRIQADFDQVLKVVLDRRRHSSGGHFSRFRDASMLSGTIRAVFFIMPDRVLSTWFTMSFSGDDVVAPPTVKDVSPLEGTNDLDRSSGESGRTIYFGRPPRSHTLRVGLYRASCISISLERLVTTTGPGESLTKFLASLLAGGGWL